MRDETQIPAVATGAAANRSAAAGIAAACFLQHSRVTDGLQTLPEAVCSCPSGGRIGFRLCFIHDDLPAGEADAIEPGDGFVGVVPGGHGDEGEAAWISRLSIQNQSYGRHSPVTFKR